MQEYNYFMVLFIVACRILDFIPCILSHSFDNVIVIYDNIKHTFIMTTLMNITTCNAKHFLRCVEKVTWGKCFGKLPTIIKYKAGLILKLKINAQTSQNANQTKVSQVLVTKAACLTGWSQAVEF